MEKLKLVSVRLETDTLRKIDEIAEKYPYFTRSTIINRILSNIINCSDEKTLWKIISTISPNTCGYAAEFYVDKEKLENLPHYE